MVYRRTQSGPAYYPQALDLGSPADKVKPRLVSASHTLNNETTFTFNPQCICSHPG